MMVCDRYLQSVQSYLKQTILSGDHPPPCRLAAHFIKGSQRGAMPKRTTPPLAFSEYVSPDSDNSVEVWQARRQLIEAAKRVYPIFLKKLSTDVFPLYCQLAKEDKLARGRNDFAKALWGKSPFEALTDDGGLKLALYKWAAQFNAEEEWLMVGALRTLRGWYVAPDWLEALAWNPQHGRKESPMVGKAFEFCHQGWEVQLLRWVDYSQSLRQNFERKLLEYENKTREFAESRGLLKARKKYSPDNLEWFVLYQFASMTSKTIADRYVVENKALDDSTVLKGIRAAATLIRWDHLRQPRQNRKIP
jgi:hypothetical protein